MIYVSSHKKLIIAEATSEISNAINGNVSISDVNLSFWGSFPKISLLLHDVSISDSLFSIHHHELLKSEKIYAQLSIRNIFKKAFDVTGIKIVNAHFYLFTDSSGYSNSYLFQSKKDTQGTADSTIKLIRLSSVTLKNVSVIIDNALKEKLINVLIKKLNSKIDDTDSITVISNKADFLINDLAFNLSNGSFAKGKTFNGNFDVKINKNSHQLITENIEVEIGKQAFKISTVFDLKGPDPQFQLKASTKNIRYSLAKEIITPKTSRALSIANLDNPFYAAVDISGPLRGGEPLIFVNWEVTNAQLTTPFLKFDKASFTGSYTNEVEKGKPRKDPNSKITVNNFSGEWNGLPVTSKNIQIINLSNSTLMADLQSEFPLSTINNLLGSSIFELRSGTIHANLTYNGPFKKNNNTNSFLNGEINFANGNILYTPHRLEMKNINGKILFKNSNVEVRNLQTTAAGSKFTMNGTANNLLTLMNTNPEKINLQWNIYTPELNLGSFLYLLSPANDKKTATKKGILGNWAKNIDEIFYRGSAKVKLNTDRLIYKKFTANKVEADVSFLPHQYLINKARLNFGNGSVDLKGSLTTTKFNYHQAEINTNIKNVDVKKLFIAFSNFGQTGINAANLQGSITANANADFALDNNAGIYPKSISSIVDFSLKNGVLTNYEPLMKIQDFIFKKRNFQNIDFAEIKNKLEISNDIVTIPRMEIASSAFDTFIEGVYGINGGTDLSIQLPLSNLKKRDDNTTLATKDIDRKTGTSLYLRGRTADDGTVHFVVDLFNKYSKEKKKEKRNKKVKD